MPLRSRLSFCLQSQVFKVSSFSQFYFSGSTKDRLEPKSKCVEKTQTSSFCLCIELSTLPFLGSCRDKLSLRSWESCKQGCQAGGVCFTQAFGQGRNSLTQQLSANMKIVIAYNRQMPAPPLFPLSLILTVQRRSWGGRRGSLSPCSLGRGKPFESSDRSDDDILSLSSGMPAKRLGARPYLFIHPPAFFLQKLHTVPL